MLKDYLIFKKELWITRWWNNFLKISATLYVNRWLRYAQMCDWALY